MGSEESINCATPLRWHELVTRLLAQTDSAAREIGDTRTILKEAIERLLPAFTAIQGLNAQQEINQSRREVVAALQFQDISDQLLAHAELRLNLLTQEVLPLLAGLESDLAQVCGVGRLSELIDKAIDNLIDVDALLINPIGKAHLSTGDSELF